jgi:uncharacterized protein YgfB (UPF0149 family)
MYQVVNTVFEELGADICAAEAQGIAVGMLSVEGNADVNNWLQEILSNNINILEKDRNVLVDLFEQTRQELNEAAEEFAFDMFLPDDDEPLWEQVEALRSWCQGFLFGLGVVHVDGEWPNEIGEVMRDIIELTKVDSDVEDEEDANLLMEVHEYVRAAVFVVRDYFLENRHS